MLAKYLEIRLGKPAAADSAESAGVPDMAYWLAPEPPQPIINVLTIDLEDWPVGVLGAGHALTERVVENTKRCLQILRWHHVRATFFVLGCVAERFPELVREVHAAGHEVASHGHGHQLLTRQSPGEFADDVQRSLDVLTAITGERPLGYRAPAFSVVESTRWAGPILADLGFKYSSSIFPIRHPRYGMPDAVPNIHRWRDCRLIECPPATIALGGRRWPVAGGGYFRLLPGSAVRTAVRRMNRAGTPAVLYMHPYELDVDGLQAHRRAGVRFGRWRQLTQGLFRSRIEPRLHQLLDGFRFTTMRELLRHVV